MKETLQKRSELFINNRDSIKSNFKFETAYLHLLCANIFTEKNAVADISRMKHCKDLLKQKTGAFSNFRSTAQLALISMLAVSDSPEERLDQVLEVYTALKRDFYSSVYLPVTAMILAEQIEPERYTEIAKRTRSIYDRMKSEHPFLTSSEDSAFAALLAMTDRDERVLIEEMEHCYKELKPKFSSGNAVQSLSHVLTVAGGSVKNQCRRTVELYDELRANGLKYGMSYELPTLGVLALLDVQKEELVKEIADVDDYLSRQKGFGFLGVGSKQRLMYAGILVAGEYLDDVHSVMYTAAVNSSISIVAAQQAAMCAAVAASSAAASSSH